MRDLAHPKILAWRPYDRTTQNLVATPLLNRLYCMLFNAVAAVAEDSVRSDRDSLTSGVCGD